MSDELFEEIEVLRSIYDDKISVQEGSSIDEVMEVQYRDQERDVVLTFHIPSVYPREPPDVEVSSILTKVDGYEAIRTCIEDTIQGNPNDIVIFPLIEAVKSVIDSRTECVDSAASESSSAVESISTSELPVDVPLECHLHIIHGPVTMEQKSSFQSHLAAVSSMDEVRLFRAKVLEDKKLARATHNIFAYRFTCKSTGIVHHDNDDDGEAAAGGRLAEMMRLMGVDGVAIIVSRWFGGILLGPDRFKFICNSARHLLEAEGFADIQKKNQPAKKR